VGGFNSQLRHSEDADLGTRLLAAGWDVVFDPEIQIATTVSNSLPEVLERYWRWNAGTEEKVSLKTYFKQIAFSIKIMAREDLRVNDFAAALVSLLSPHYQFWVTFWRRATRPRP
jgi:cellulose synthase/poly-beta-1,6-N-acetylglucosamine synthase-like glycosyltransferase